MSLNKVMLIGNVGKDPEVRYLDTGICVASFSLATTERGYTLQNGTQVPERTEWHSIICWNNNAKFVEEYVRKGDKLYIEGKIQTRTYNDRQGINRKLIEIMANDVQIMSQRSQAGNTAIQGAPSATQHTIKPGQSATTSTEEQDSVPF